MCAARSVSVGQRRITASAGVKPGLQIAAVMASVSVGMGGGESSVTNGQATGSRSASSRVSALEPECHFGSNSSGEMERAKGFEIFRTHQSIPIKNGDFPHRHGGYSRSGFWRVRSELPAARRFFVMQCHARGFPRRFGFGRSVPINKPGFTSRDSPLPRQRWKTLPPCCPCGDAARMLHRTGTALRCALNGFKQEALAKTHWSLSGIIVDSRKS